MTIDRVSKIIVIPDLASEMVHPLAFSSVTQS